MRVYIYMICSTKSSIGFILKLKGMTINEEGDWFSCVKNGMEWPDRLMCLKIPSFFC